MYYVRVPKRIHQIIGVFQRIGLWDIEEGNVCRKGLKLFQFFFYVLSPSSILASAFNTDDKVESVFVAGAGIVVVLHLMRLFYIILRKHETIALIHRVGSFIIEDQEDFTRVNNKMKNLIKFGTYLVLMIVTTVAAALCYHGVKGDKTLPCNLIFLVDYRDFENSEIFYWISLALFLAETAYTGVVLSFNIIVWYLMFMFSTKYELLGNQIKYMGKLTKITTRELKALDVEEQKLFLQDLIAAIKAHRTIREQINQFQSCFSTLFFMEIVTSGLCICVSVYALAFSSYDLFNSSLYVVILSYVAFNMYVIMYFGNEIKLSSNRLSYCLFECNWIEQSNSCKQLIIIEAEFLKRAHELVIGILYPLNLGTFTSILNLAYSMFNILRNLR